MKFFIDTADINEIKQGLEMKMVDGVTTNPSLVAKTGKPFDTVIKEILDIVDGPVSLEVTALEAEGMLAQAKELAAKAENVVVKIPLTVEGIRATAMCTDAGIKTNVTLCFSANQALLAAKAGATYVSPFVGRLDDEGSEGMQLIEDIIQIYDNYDFDTEVLVASIRNPIHVKLAAMMGADVSTIPFSVIKQLAYHPLTDTGLAKFMKDWEKVPK